MYLGVREIIWRVRALVLHEAVSDLNLRILYGPQTLITVIPDCRDRRTPEHFWAWPNILPPPKKQGMLLIFRMSLSHYY